LRSGGKERRFVELLHYLKNKTKYEMQVVVLNDDIHYDYIYDLGIQIKILTRKRLNKDPRIFFSLFKIAYKFKPTIIHTWGSMSTVYALPAKIILHIPIIANLVANAKKLNKWSFNNFLFRVSCHYSTIILSNSLAGIKAYGIKGDKSKVIYNGVRLERFNKNINIKKVREDIGIKTRLVVIMVASFSKNKDYDLFVNVAKVFASRGTDVSFVAIGDGETFELIQKRLKNEEISNVYLLGKQQKIEEFIAVADIGVLFTNNKYHSEGISNSIIEYMALGKAVISTDLYGGSREIIENEENGYILDNNIKEIVEKLNVLFENEMLRDSMGKKGKHKIKTKFSLDRMGKEFLDCYDHVQFINKNN
jgi:glycosyltransferase involved in cell wall biosynthesis